MNIKEYISSGLLEQFVLGLCSTEEVTEVQSLRKQYIEIDAAIIQCETELENYYTNNNKYNLSVEVNSKILSSLQNQNKPHKNKIIINSTQVITFNWLKFTAAAAIILLVVSAFFNYLLYKKNNQPITFVKQEPQLTLPANNFNVLKNPSIIPIAMMGQGYHAICRCTMFWDKNTGKAYIMVHHLIKSGTNYDYQLWAIVNGKKISVGILDDTIRDKFIELNGMPNAATEFIVTLENVGGAQVPNDDVFLKGKI